MLFDGFNVACQNIAAIFLKVGDESMSAVLFRTTAKGNLTHLSYILCKTEPLGTDFKKIACYVTDALIFIEVQRGKEGMKHRNYQKELGTTAACTKIMTEATKRIDQKSIKGGQRIFYFLIVG